MIAAMNLLRISAALLVWSAAQLVSGGSITGTIRLSGGGPAAGVRVAAMVVPGVRLVTNGASELAAITQTDSNGRYQLDGITPGRYFIVAGAVSSPTFYPGTLVQNAASIVTVTRDAGTLTGIDIALSAVSANPVGGVRKIIHGQMVTEDGSPLPNISINVTTTGNNFSIEDGGTFRFVAGVGEAILIRNVDGLPPGYFLKSVSYGGRNFGLGPMTIDASQAIVVLTLGFQPSSMLPKVLVRGKVLNVARELNTTSLILRSTMPDGPTVVARLQPDRSFEFPSIPIGTYRTGVRSDAGNESVSWIMVVIRDTISNLTIDLKNNPFPEFQGAGPTRSSPFIGGKKTEITGVVTQRLTGIAPPDVEYFRMDVKDESTGAVTAWAIYVAHDFQAPNIMVGETLTVAGTLSTDGTNRMDADPF
jgi:hypothetical protein